MKPIYVKELESLISTLEKHNLIVLSVSSGPNEEFEEPTLDNLTCCDNLIIKIKHTKTMTQTWMALVYGNSVGELVSDWGIPANKSAAIAIEEAVNEYCDEWEL